ncbi:hypothetical protein V493_00527, partial [Pseudogymnoascus sp. VKM F-4281 (FW-2241)]
MEQQFLELQRRFAAEQLKSRQAEARAEEEQRLREEEQLKSKQAEARAEGEQRLREEEQLKSKQAEARAEEEQRLREEEQLKSKQAEARAEEEQRLREEEQLKSKQAEARAEEEQHLREEEQRRREAAEAESQPKNLIEYLETCHSFSLALKVITDKSLSTRGDTTVPTGRPYPQRIVPWGDFPAQQEKIWEKLSISPDFNSQRVFPSEHQLDYVLK